MKKQNLKQPNPYRIDRLAMIPVQVKAVFIKFWFAGAVYFFLGLGVTALNTVSQLDVVIVLGIILGMVTDLMVNNIFRYLATDKNDFGPYMVFGSKSLSSFFLNILYNLILSVLIAYTYNTINVIAIETGTVEAGQVWLTAEPILYGAFYLVYDFIVLGIKVLFRLYKSKHIKRTDK